ncbi:hypothetical protein [Flexithrix dorotheae]|uniref:hypothetical protein n=1 Tax=Flexithrix dorotheae TaxID=70993 RepID=UPI00037CB172|nr:hypothetical protein [Flexithrix dorotheae]
MVTENKFSFLINKIQVTAVLLLILFNVSHLESLSSFLNSSLDYQKDLVEITKISASSDHQKKDPKGDNLPFSENKPEEDSDEETKENTKEKNDLNDYHQNNFSPNKIGDTFNISRVCISHFKNRKTLIPLYVLFHSWKDYLI